MRTAAELPGSAASISATSRPKIRADVRRKYSAASLTRPGTRLLAICRQFAQYPCVFQDMHRLAAFAVSTALLAGLVAAQGSTAGTPLPVTDPTIPAARDADPVVLTGRDFPGWAASANVTAKLPLTDLTGDPITGEPAPGSGCTTFDAQCDHNHYAKPDFDSQDYAPQEGVPVGRLLGYRWNAKAGKTGKFV